MTTEDPFAQPSASRTVVDPEGDNAAYSFDGKPDRWKRYRLPDPVTGEPTGFTRATTFAKSISDTYTLSLWQQRKVAQGIAENDDLLMAVASTDPDDRDSMNKLVETAKDRAGAKSGANIGTALHAFTEAVDRGEKPRIPAKWRPHVAAWTALLTKYNMQVIEIEKRVLHTGWGVAGTLDRVVRFTKDTEVSVGSGKGKKKHTFKAGTTAILDLKTGRTLEYGWMEIAVQLDIYADASWIFDQDEPGEPYEWRSMYPEIDHDVALVIHIPAVEAEAEATLYAVDLRFGRETGALCELVRNARKRKNIAAPIEVIQELTGDVLVVPSERADVGPSAPKGLPGAALSLRPPTLMEQVQNAVTEDALTSIWFGALRSRETSKELTVAIQQRRLQLLADTAAG